MKMVANAFAYTVFLVLAVNAWLCRGITRHYRFNVKLHNVTHLCKTKSMITVNGKFPGPRIVARDGDQLIIKVVNHVQNNISIHWHGVRQLGFQWADGPAYITQCPIQMNNSYVYNFTINGQRGTLFWHVHTSWLRASVYGPIVILPRKNHSYPFPKPHKDLLITLGEWWNNDTEAIISEALQTGGGPNVSDAYTFNGFPGPLYNSCTGAKALNDELFFSIANHTMKVVQVDALFVKPFETDTLLIAPGQTTNFLLKTKPNPNPNPKHTTYLMAVSPYATGSGTFDNTTAAAILEYDTSKSKSRPINVTLKDLPRMPSMNDTIFAANFSKKLRSLANAEFPVNVPQTIDKQLLFTVGLGTTPCPKNQTCQGPTNRTKFAATINNISMSTHPTTAIMQAYSNNNNGGVYTTDFPKFPLNQFNYTGTPPSNTNVMNGTTKVVVILYNTSVEVVMQDTSILSAESHPLHLHGYNFYVVGHGFGNFDPKKDPPNYNLVDPVERNTVAVPSAGWVAIRFRADNPGVWFMHCHFEVHISWGLRMAWIVLDGDQPNQKLPPPPADLPKC